MITNKKDPAASPLNVALFTFPVTGQTVRTVIHEGKPWFVARDVALVLGYTNTKDACIKFCKYLKTLKGRETRPLTNSPRGINIIPESDVFRLVMRSRLPQAEAFQDWVCEEVLPTIRKTGQYQTPQPTPTTTAAPAPQPDALSAILSRLVSIEQQITPLKEKANRYDAFLAVDGTCSLTQAAKLFNMTGIGLGRLLRGEHMKWLFKRPGRNGDANLPTKETIELGYMVAKAVRSPYNGALSIQARFTPVGLDALHQKLECLRRELLPLPEGTPDASTVREATYDCTPVNRPQ